MSTTRTPFFSKLLRDKLASVRVKQLYVALGTGVAWICLASVVLLALGMYIDWHIDLRKETRILLLVIDVIMLSMIFSRYIATPLTNQPSDERVALAVEEATPEFQTRLIAATQFGQSSTTNDTGAVFVRALVKETEGIAQTKDFKSIVPVHELARALFVGLLVIGLSALAYSKAPIKIGDLLKRALLTPGVAVPRDTHMDSITFHYLDHQSSEPREIFARQDNILIKVAIKGSSRLKNPDSARITIKYAGGKIDTDNKLQNIAPSGEPGLYQYAIKKAGESFTVTASANDSFPISKEIKVVPRPAVKEIRFVQKYPSYTELVPVNRNPGDLKLLTGSDLEIEVNATKPITRWQLRATSADENSTEWEIDGVKGAGLSTTMTNLVDVARLRIKLWDEHGFDSRNEAEYRIKILPDKPPVVRFLNAKKETKVTTRANLPIKILIRDDYGVSKVVLNSTFGNSPPLPKPLPMEPGQSIIEYEWDLSEVKPLVGTEIKYWVEAFDDAPKQNNGTSRNLAALVVTDAEKRDELVNRATDSLTGVNESADKEEKLNLELSMIISRPREKYIATRVNNIGTKIRSLWFPDIKEVKWEILGFHHQGNLAFVETSCTPNVGSNRVIWVIIFPSTGQLEGESIGVYLQEESGYVLHKQKNLEEINGIETLSKSLPNSIRRTFDRHRTGSSQ